MMGQDKGEMTMRILYHNDMSTCAQKARVTLAEKGLTWESRHLDLRAGDQQEPEYLKLNPKGVVPTLVDGDNFVRESNVILEYLDDEYPDPPLRPATSMGRARMRLWIKRLDEGLHDIATATLSMGTAFRFQYLDKTPAQREALIEKIPDPIKRERRRDVVENGLEAKEFTKAAAMMNAFLGDMETALKDTTWVAGDDYCIADAAFTPYLTRLDHLNYLGFIADRPHVADWYDRIKARPSYDAAITEWLNQGYWELMQEKGAEAWPRVKEILAGL
jgi:glutathione S-transferase